MLAASTRLKREGEGQVNQEKTGTTEQQREKKIKKEQEEKK